jgi:hypothetical protein
MNRALDFTLIIDDISLASNELLKNMLTQKSKHNNIIVTKDLYAMAGGKDDIFATLIGNAEKTVLFTHNSGVSCEKWSKFISDYDKLDVSGQTFAGWNAGSSWGFNSGSGQQEKLQREARVKPEEIRGLKQDEAYIYDHVLDSLIKTMIV